MEKFRTHAGPKTFEDIVSEIMKKPKPADSRVYAARAVLPGEVNPNEKVRLGPVDYGVQDSKEASYLSQEPMSVPTGPVGATGAFPYCPPGANGPAGPAGVFGATGAPFLVSEDHGVALTRDRAEVDLRKAVRRCLKEGVHMDRIVEIFRLELVDVVHDE